MPCRPITDKQNIVICILLRELFQKEVHAFSVASRHHPETAVSGFRFYRSIDISVFTDMMAWHNGPDPLSAPASCRLAYPSKPRFVLKQDPHPFWGDFLSKLIVSSLNFLSQPDLLHWLTLDALAAAFSLPSHAASKHDIHSCPP